MPSSLVAKQILVINSHSSQNAGDAALLEMALASLRPVFPGSQIVLAMNEPEIGRNMDDVRVVRSFTSHFRPCQADRQARWQIGVIIWGMVMSLVAAVWYRICKRSPGWLPGTWRELLSAYMDADLVISCPGNIFVTMGRFGMPFITSAFATAYGLMLGKPLYVMPQSIGPLERRWERRVVRHLYSRARLVFIREPVSLRLANEIGLANTTVRLVPDLAFAFPGVSLEKTEVSRELGCHSERPMVGVTVINRLIRHVSADDWDRYEKSMVYALSSFINKYDGMAVFFPQVIGPTEKEDDRVAARRIIAQMANPERAILVDKPVSPGKLKTMYGLMDIFVATRMHSAIFSTSMGVPTLLIEYLHKMRGLAEMLRQEEWVLELSQVNETDLWKMLDSLWQRRPDVRHHLECFVPSLVEQVNLVGETIARDFYG